MTTSMSEANLINSPVMTPTSISLHARELDLDVVRGLAILLAMGWHFNGEPFDIACLLYTSPSPRD